MTPGDGGTLLPTDEKSALRRLLKDRRARYVAGLPASVQGIAFRVLPTPVLKRLSQDKVIALYHAGGVEAPTENIATQLDELGYRLALPRFDGETGAMGFALWDRDRILVPGPFRTLQPDAGMPMLAPDVIIAPLVGFDAALNRLGQGGGYYDRAFTAWPNAMRIGLAWSVQQVDVVPVDAHDLPLDMVVTEAALWERQEATA